LLKFLQEVGKEVGKAVGQRLRGITLVSYVHRSQREQWKSTGRLR
jgi:hypothetical protein